ncbi:MAG: Nif3-like dinuclear metal center hexameric protein [Myxococcales bacterium]|nr:Nif3-like dinuclear metal center hexameric protein [Myxococcales bacterium]
MAAQLRDIVAHLDKTLAIAAFRDYAPNGLQVQGAPEVTRIVTGVSANAALFARAEALGAELIVVHHGLIWGGGIARVEGLVAERLRHLLTGRISLAAYHLPLDAHATLGNNAGLVEAMGLVGADEAFGDVRGYPLGVAVTLAAPMPRDELVQRAARLRGGTDSPPFVFNHGPAQVRKVGLCTGAASDLLEAASAAGCDAFVTGELAERAQEVAAELGITLIAAGHHATETFGAARLAKELARAFPTVRSEFVNVPGAL